MHTYIHTYMHTRTHARTHTQFYLAIVRASTKYCVIIRFNVFYLCIFVFLFLKVELEYLL